MAKFIIIATVILISIYLTEQAYFLSEEYIAKINEESKTWTAQQNFPPDTSERDIKRLLGLGESKRLTDALKRLVENSDAPLHKDNHFSFMPKRFDARNRWKKCTTIGEVRNMGNCVACWAHSTTGAFADRLCIATRGKFNQLLSAENLAFCCPYCSGGCHSENFSPYLAWVYFQINGVVTGGNYNTSDGCQPYQIPPCIRHHKGPGSCSEQPPMDDPQCTQTCYGDESIDYNNDLRRVKKVYTLTNAVSMQRDIFIHGPIETKFSVYSDFLSYKSGVYVKSSNTTYLGGLSVKVIGWGEDNGVPYWLMVNSWGVEFGDQGLFKFLRGQDHCGAEEGATAGIPL
ncbi:Peptidase C1A, papain C-terminal,Peptidase C1A, propeptide [Cinara cedri]|uniref:Peptidase C1A, papain C-terminal,Peptidase C1A, propeptide n=1 Tax=Cinara cedri TaxID=506608 RepID=A0A5E4MGR9_9HEMI|nr:Peptidase C1A, papain C-terminal,Peptidase C1A, propeptide [Cinara cedri]